MSSVTDQLQGNVGKRNNASVGADKEMCGAEEKVRRDNQREMKGDMTARWEMLRGTLEGGES